MNKSISKLKAVNILRIICAIVNWLLKTSGNTVMELLTLTGAVLIKMLRWNVVCLLL